ncbi:MAG: molybdopterin molybdenumtransferase MoeA, partial [Bacteroidota bacterium]
MISFTEAKKIILAQSFDWGQEEVDLSKAGGRVLAEPVYVDRPQPPFDRVTMDGIAIHYPTYAEGQRFYPIERMQAAGAPPLPLTNTNYCVEIMTGAALPPGVSTVIRYEDLTPMDGGFRLPEGIMDQKNIHFSGSEIGRA